MDELMLKKFQPHQNLNMLTVDGYRGTRLSGWIMELHCSLPNLTKITLCNLPHYEQLPPFEHLTNLETLEIHNALKIKGIQTDLQASSGSFKKLKILSIRDMPDLEEWSLTALTNDTKLEKLEIYKCPRVIFRPCLPSTDISIITKSSMSLSLLNGVSLSSMSRITKMYMESCSVTSDEWGGLIRSYTIKDLEIKSCEELYFLPKSIKWIPSLESLTINNCNCLSALPEWLGDSLKSLSISRCSNLKSFKGPFRTLKILSIREIPDLEEWLITNSTDDITLQSLEIYRCPRVIFRPSLPKAETLVITESSMSLSSGSIASQPSKSIFSKVCIESCAITSDEWGGLSHYVIKDLEIKSCKELYFLPKGIVGVTSLKSLTINDCNSLSILPEWLGECISLKSLSINRCANLKSIRGSFRKLKILSIREMPDLEEWSIIGLTNDIILERIEIYRCPRVIFRPCLPSTDTLVITESNISLSLANAVSPSSMPIIFKMCIENCSITSDEWEGLGCYIIEDLEIKSCKEMYFLPKSIVWVNSLETLTINDCNCLSALPEWLGELTSLKSLSISRCLNLKSLPQSILCLTVLENLLVQHCSPELVDHCQRVNKNKIHHVCPRGLVSFVRGEESESYDLDDIHQASVELLDSDAFGTTHKYQLEKGKALMVRPLREMNISEKEFRIKMRILGAMKHPTLMPLCAYYYGEDEKLLVYDYMPIGSLSLWLHGMKDSGKSSLNWGARSRIALAVAQGLKYIHETSLQWNNIPGVVHGNIKSSNILLCGNNRSPDGAKIFNYGIAQIMGGRADDAYKAPELKDFRQVTQMSDVYSFGVLIMELLTGRNPKSTHIPGWVRQTFHGQWLDVELSRENQMAQQEMMKLMQLAMECVAYNPERRPTMEVVVHQIEDICEQ